MIGDSANTLFANLPDATPVEAEHQYGAQNSQPDISTAFLNAFRGTGTAEQTSDFAAALGSATTETPAISTLGTEDFAHALEKEGQEAHTDTAKLPESQPVFSLAELSSANDAKELTALQLELARHTAGLQAKVLEAQAQNAAAVREEAKFLMADTAGMEGVYYVTFVQQLIISVQRAIKSMITIATSSASYGASWRETMNIHSRQKDELKLQAQAAG